MDLFEESIIITNEDLQIMYVNQAFENLFRRSYKDIKNIPITSILPDIVEEGSLTRQSIMNKEYTGFRYMDCKWDGREMVLRIQTKIHFDEQEKVGFIMIQLEDVTKQVRLQKEQETLIKEMTVKIIPITDTVSLLPLHSINTETQKNMLVEQSLEQCKRLKSRYLALDLSSLHIIDDELAFILERLLASLKILGVEVVISGIQPKIIPHLSNSFPFFTGIKTYRTLHQALTELLTTQDLPK